jgi:GNAT superfamily N-acetyltransferase
VLRDRTAEWRRRQYRGVQVSGTNGDGSAAAGVDVFPEHRGHGFGTALLEGVRRLLVAENITTLVVGADDDDWPLDRYRRLGFRDVARVNKS